MCGGHVILGRECIIGDNRQRLRPYGLHTSLPWGVDFGDGPRHPTQLYKTAFHLSAAACLAVMERYDLCRGQRIKLYIMAYLVYRFATEYVRPEPRLWLSLTGYQWACLAWLPVFAGLWSHDRVTAGAASTRGREMKDTDTL